MALHTEERAVQKGSAGRWRGPWNSVAQLSLKAKTMAPTLQVCPGGDCTANSVT